MLTTGHHPGRFFASHVATMIIRDFFLMLPTKMFITAVEILITADMKTELSTQTIIRTLEAMHWIICPYTIDDS